MPLEIHFEPERRILYGRMIGEFLPDDLIAVFDRVEAAGNIPRDADIIWDMRALDFSAITVDVMKSIVKRRRQINSFRKNAASYYVVLGPVEERMIRLMIAVSVGIEKPEQIFRTLEAATEHLMEFRKTSGN